MREKTAAHRRYKDDVPNSVKQKRLERMIKTYRMHAEFLNRSQIGRLQLILIEGHSKRSTRQLVGRNDQNIKVIFFYKFVTSILYLLLRINFLK